MTEKRDRLYSKGENKEGHERMKGSSGRRRSECRAERRLRKAYLGMLCMGGTVFRRWEARREREG
jgi:hypothetical protein